MQKNIGIATVVCSVLLLAAPAEAQFELGSIVGVVTDPQEGPLVGASVEIRSLSTNVIREVKTGSTGEYNSMPLQPGRYSISVKHPGFREGRTEVTLGTGQRLQADVRLELGAVTEHVNVTASAGVIETASSEISQVRTSG